MNKYCKNKDKIMKQNIFTRYFHNKHYKKNPKNMKQNIITRAQEGHYPSLADVRRRGHLKRVGTAHASVSAQTNFRTSTQCRHHRLIHPSPGI